MIGQTISHCRIMDGYGEPYFGAVVKTLAVLSLCAFLSGCGSSSPNLTGNWQFTVKSTANGSTYTGTGSITQSSGPVDSLGAGSHERTVTGSLTIANDPCGSAASLSGTISDSSVVFTITEGGQPVSFTGNVNAAFTAMSGNYASPLGGCTNGDFGSWVASKS
jgi:hypothetical protein